MAALKAEDVYDNIKNKETSSPASLDLDYKLKEVDQSSADDVESIQKRYSSNVYSIMASGAALIS